jgi:chlorite dismutase
MNHRKEMMINHVVVVTDDGPMGVHSWEEVKDIIFYHFGICKHEFSVTHSSPDPFVAFFNDTHDKDVIFATRRVVDGPI